LLHFLFASVAVNVQFFKSTQVTIPVCPVYEPVSIANTHHTTGTLETHKYFIVSIFDFKVSPIFGAFESNCDI
jgi:hypothetical protein